MTLQPGEFLGRRSSRVGLGFAVCLLWVLVVLCFAPIPFLPSKGQGFFAFLGLCGLLVFGGVSTIGVRQYLIACSTIRLLPEGLWIGHPLGSRLVSWTAMRTTRRPDVTTNSLTVIVRGERPLILPLAFVEDGAELGRIIESNIAELSAVAAMDGVQTRTFRPQNLAVSAFAVCMMSFMSMGMGMFASHAPARHGAAIGPGLLTGIACMLLVAVLLPMLTVSIRISPARIVSTRIFASRSIDFADIVAVEDVKTGLTIRSNSTKINVDKSISDYELIRKTVIDRADPASIELLRASSEQALPKRSAAELAAADSRAFEMGADTKSGFYLLIAMGVLIAIGGVAVEFLPKARPPEPALSVISLALGVTLVVGGFVALRRSFTLCGDELTAKSVFGAKTVRLTELTRAEVSAYRAQKSNQRIERLTLEEPGGGLSISSQVADYELLRDAILARVNPAIVRTDRMGDA